MTLVCLTSSLDNQGKRESRLVRRGTNGEKEVGETVLVLTNGVVGTTPYRVGTGTAG